VVRGANGLSDRLSTMTGDCAAGYHSSVRRNSVGSLMLSFHVLMPNKGFYRILFKQLKQSFNHYRALDSLLLHWLRHGVRPLRLSLNQLRVGHLGDVQVYRWSVGQSGAVSQVGVTC
jgi:hypothetical protein